MNDNELKDYFHQRRPHTSDESTYLAALSAKMDAVAQIKAMHDASIKKYRRICAVTFAAGCAAGIFVTALIILKPFVLSASILSNVFSLAYEWKIAIAIFIAATSLVLGLIPWKKGFEVSPIK